MTKFLYVKNGKIEIDVDEWDRLKQWEGDLLASGQFYQKCCYTLWLLTQRLPIDECLHLQMVQDENNYLIARLEEMSGDLIQYEYLIKSILTAKNMNEVKEMIGAFQDGEIFK
jgi:hypothetical protein